MTRRSEASPRVKMVTVAVTITKPMRDAIKRLIESGRYGSVSEVVREALRRFLKEEGLMDGG